MASEISGIHNQAAEKADPFFQDLSPRECTIMGLLVCGFSTPEIAEKIAISPNTAADYIKHLYRKLEVTSRKELLSQYFGPADPQQLQSLSETYGLTEKEKQVVNCIMQGQSIDRASETLYRSPYTIRDMLKHIFKKCNLHGTDELFVLVHGHPGYSSVTRPKDRAPSASPA